MVESLAAFAQVRWGVQRMPKVAGPSRAKAQHYAQTFSHLLDVKSAELAYFFNGYLSLQHLRRDEGMPLILPVGDLRDGGRYHLHEIVKVLR